jgi:HEAT repeats
MLLSTVRGAVALTVLTTLAASSADAAPAPRLRSLLKTAPLVVGGEVTAVTPYDDERVTVVQMTADRVLKGTLAREAGGHIQLVELHEGPRRPSLAAGARGIAFLRPAARTSYFARVLPPGTYYELLPEFGAFLPAESKAEAERQAALVARLMAAARGEVMDAKANRQVTFDLLASRSPLLVEDAAAGLADLGRVGTLSDAELDILNGALGRADLPKRVRIALIEAVAHAGLYQAVPALQGIAAPPAVAEAAWQALDALGAPPTEKSLTERLADPEPPVRAAAVRELLRREGVAAVSQVAPVAVQDPDPTVRRAAVDALGALGKPEALPPLERVFTDSPTDLKQATGRAILAVGGQPAIDAFGRLAFAGSIESQRYAVVLLMTMTDERKQPVLEHIAETHPDEQTRRLLEHGLDVHGH